MLGPNGQLKPIIDTKQIYMHSFSKKNSSLLLFLLLVLAEIALSGFLVRCKPPKKASTLHKIPEIPSSNKPPDTKKHNTNLKHAKTARSKRRAPRRIITNSQTNNATDNKNKDESQLEYGEDKFNEREEVLQDENLHQEETTNEYWEQAVEKFLRVFKEFVKATNELNEYITQNGLSFMNLSSRVFRIVFDEKVFVKNLSLSELKKIDPEELQEQIEEFFSLKENLCGRRKKLKKQLYLLGEQIQWKDNKIKTQEDLDEFTKSSKELNMDVLGFLGATKEIINRTKKEVKKPILKMFNKHAKSYIPVGLRSTTRPIVNIMHLLKSKMVKPAQIMKKIKQLLSSKSFFWTYKKLKPKIQSIAYQKMDE